MQIDFSTYEQELNELEAQLELAFRRGEVKHVQYCDRLGKIETIRTELEKALIASQPGADPILVDSDPQQHSMSSIDFKSEEESKIVYQSYTDRINAARYLYDTLSSCVSRSLEFSIRPRGSFFKGIFQLSKLHKWHRDINQMIQRTEYYDQQMDKKISKLVMPLQHHQGTSDPGSNLQGLIAIFSEIDQCAARISTLRTQTQREEAYIQDMKKWLQTQEDQCRINGASTSYSPPSPKTLQNIEAHIDPEADQILLQAKERLASANAFICAYKQRGADL